jgi:hypothetical protein
MALGAGPGPHGRRETTEPFPVKRRGGINNIKSRKDPSSSLLPGVCCHEEVLVDSEDEVRNFLYNFASSLSGIIACCKQK